MSASNLKPEFNFDSWARLYKDNPEEFERQRHAALRGVVDNAPEALKPRLEGCLFKIEMHRRKAANPLHGVILASNMMWEAFREMQARLNALASESKSDVSSVADDKPASVQTARVPAKLIALRPARSAHCEG